MTFTNRADAGRQLAARLASMALEQPVVFALPRGGVPVAIEISRALRAPLDLVMVRKIGSPLNPEVAVGAVVEGTTPRTILNEAVRQASGADDAYIKRIRTRELAEMERRRALYLGRRPRVDPAGRTVILVDDGLATGATMKAAITAIRQQGARRIVVAVPVALVDALADVAALADDAVCLNPARDFRGVSAFFEDFHQLTDEETIDLLRQAWGMQAPPPAWTERPVAIPPHGLAAELAMPADPRGIVLFAHGSGSSRLSPRNRAVAARLNEEGHATLLLDLLTPDEAADRRNVFDIALLAERLAEASLWIASEPDLADLPLGLFGASTGAAAALLAAAAMPNRVAAIVSRGGRPDLVSPRLMRVRAPTLFIVGGDDEQVIALNRGAMAELSCEKMLTIIPGAGHVFEEPGALDQVARLAAAWFRQHLRRGPRIPAAAPPPTPAQMEVLRNAAEPLPPLDDPEFAAGFDRFATSRIVLLGEASHGTSEFYRARAAITRRLIERHGFRIVALEADWPDAAALDRHVRHVPRQPMRTLPFSRFPVWMWRNEEMDAFVAFLRSYNGQRPPAGQARLCGLDLYNMSASIAAVLAYLDQVDPAAARIARGRYGCLEPWSRKPAAYGREALTRGYAICEEAVVQTLLDLLRKELDYARRGGELLFDTVQNARLIVDAERYYRVMYYGAHHAWNLRDQHMFETLRHLLDRLGPGGKAVVWAHNSHIGDARATEMGTERGELNLGQLCRQAYGADAVLVGLGTHTGTVAAASDWDAAMEVKAVPASRPDSYEALCHAVGIERFLLDLRPGKDDALRRVLLAPRLERYIGVIYRPETERQSHYSHARLADQYDAFLWLDATSSVHPIATRSAAGEDETYPFGF